MLTEIRGAETPLTIGLDGGAGAFLASNGSDGLPRSAERRCLHQAVKKGFLELGDVTPVPWRYPSHHVPADMLAKIETCRSDGQRVFWLFSMRGVPPSQSLRPEVAPMVFDQEIYTITAVCVPYACSSKSVGMWLAPIALRQNELRATYSFQERRQFANHFLNPVCSTDGKSCSLPSITATSLADIPQLPDSTYVQYFNTPPWSDTYVTKEDHAFAVIEHTLKRTSTLPHLSQLSKISRGVAVCFAGSLRLSREVLKTVRAHMVNVLKADVFGVFSLVPLTVQEKAQALFLEFFPSTRELEFVKDLTREEFDMILRKSPMYTYYIGSKAHLLSPLIQKGNQLHLYFKQSRVLNLLAAYEEKRSQRYELVVFSRVDMQWFADHPAAYHFNPDCVWVDFFPFCASSGTKPFDNVRDASLSNVDKVLFCGAGGVNDNHAVMSRANAEVYFRRWDLLESGNALFMPLTNGHYFLHTMLTVQFNLLIGTFEGVSALSCCPKEWKCFHEQGRACGDRQDGIYNMVRDAADKLANGSRWVSYPGTCMLTISDL